MQGIQQVLKSNFCMNENTTYTVDYLTAGAMSYLSLHSQYPPKYLSTKKGLSKCEPMSERVIRKNHHRGNTKDATFGKDSALFLTCLWWWSRKCGKIQWLPLAFQLQINGRAIGKKMRGLDVHWSPETSDTAKTAVDPPLSASYFIP